MAAAPALTERGGRQRSRVYLRSRLLNLLVWGLLCSCPGAFAEERSCEEVLGIPKVAIMFLARGGLPLEVLWKAWFESVALAVPGLHAHSLICTHSEDLAKVGDDGTLSAGHCTMPQNVAVLDRQFLYSVFVHSSRIDFEDFRPDSVFHGTLLPEQAVAEWGDTSDAVRMLLRAALQDPLNQNFMLLSDTDAPLYPASLVYQQLIQEDKSRMASCWEYDLVDMRRYSCAMEAEGLGMHLWRKSALWFTMPRRHAELVVEEEVVRGIFKRHCNTTKVDVLDGERHGCLVDEHYYASLFAYLDLAKETDCFGIITIADFRRSVAGHPKMYIPEDINIDLLRELRAPIWWLPKAQCANASIAEARSSFIALEELQTGLKPTQCNFLFRQGRVSMMETHCQLFGRKFHPDSAQPLLELYRTAPDPLVQLDDGQHISCYTDRNVRDGIKECR